MKMKHFLQAVSIVLVLLCLTACQKNADKYANDRLINSLPSDMGLTINGTTHRYIKYEGRDGVLSALKLPQAEYTLGELLVQTEKFSYYEAMEATLGEAAIRTNNETGEVETLVVCRFTDFDSVEEILNFFGITSAESIRTVDVYTLKYKKKAKDTYKFYGSYDNIGGEIYELLATMEKNFAAKNGDPLVGTVASDRSTFDYEAWADGVLKLDVTLSNGIVLPVLYSEVNNYVAILDAVTNFSGHPDEAAVNGLKAALRSK